MRPRTSEGITWHVEPTTTRRPFPRSAHGTARLERVVNQPSDLFVTEAGDPPGRELVDDRFVETPQPLVLLGQARGQPGTLVADPHQQTRRARLVGDRDLGRASQQAGG